MEIQVQHRHSKIRNRVRQGCHLTRRHQGRTRYTITFSRLYKHYEQWKTTQTFGCNDLLVLAKVADQAHTRIFELQEDGEAQE